MAQSVKGLTLDIDSGHDLTVVRSSPIVGLCTVSAEPTWESPSPSLSLSLPCSLILILSLSLSLKMNK